MPQFSGRDGDNTSHAGEIERDEIPIFIAFCEAFEWKRCAVAEGMTILAAHRDGKTWLHPTLIGQL